MPRRRWAARARRSAAVARRKTLTTEPDGEKALAPHGPHHAARHTHSHTNPLVTAMSTLPPMRSAHAPGGAHRGAGLNDGGVSGARKGLWKRGGTGFLVVSPPDQH